MPWILWRTVLRSTLWPFVVLLFALSALLLLLLALRLAELAPGTRLAWEDVYPLFAHGLPHLSKMAVPVAWLGAVLLGLGQLSADGGYLAARAAGIGPIRLTLPLIVLGVLLTLGSLASAVFAEPWSNRNLRRALVRLAKTGAVTGLRPGVFTDALGDVVLQVGARGETGELREVLVADRRDPAWALVAFAARGRLHADAGSDRLLLHLSDGELQSRSADGRHFRRAKFATYELAFDVREFLSRRTALVSGFDELDLEGMRNEIARARGLGHVTWRYELIYHRKLALPFAPLLFSLLGIGLALGRVRAPRVRAALLGVLLLGTYFGLQRAGDTMAAEGVLPYVLCAWLPTLGLIPAALVAMRLTMTGRR